MTTDRAWIAPIDVEAMEQLAHEREEFHWNTNDGERLRSLNYRYMKADTFNDPKSIEGRGLQIEAATATVAARPLHKFFNWGERPESDALIEWDAPHQICEKLDGTLMFPAEFEDGSVTWCTRAGRTEIADTLKAMIPEEALTRAATLVRAHDGTALTPCFEHTCAENRIVIGYKQARLTLLALRERESGRYLTREEITREAQRAPIGTGADDAVQIAIGLEGPRITVDDIAATVAEIEAGTGYEGVVIVFDDGLRVKIKTREYIELHTLRTYAESEKQMLRCVLEAREDALWQIMPQRSHAPIKAYMNEVRTGIERNTREVAEAVEALSRTHAQRKTFAQAWEKQEQHGIRRAMGFRARKAWEEHDESATTARRMRADARDLLITMVLRKCSSNTKIEKEVRPVIGQQPWRNPLYELEEG